MHLGKIPENGGQILKEFLIDNQVDVGKFKSFTSKRCASEDCTKCENNDEFTRIRRKKLRLELINYLISLTVVGTIKSICTILVRRPNILQQCGKFW